MKIRGNTVGTTMSPERIAERIGGGSGGGGEELTAHINDKNNPHKVYAEQIGAAPANQVGDMYDVYSVSHLLAFYDSEKHEYIDQNGNQHEQENCTLYCIPVMNDECAELLGKRLRIKTYAYGDMSYHLEGASGATNANANIEEDPQSGIWEFEVDIPEDYRHLFKISFCSNDYLNAPEAAISQGTVWEQVKALQEFRDNLADYLPIYNGEVL